MTPPSLLHKLPNAPIEEAHLLLTRAAMVRAEAREDLSSERQTALGQFFTPLWVAELMASMVPPRTGLVRVLDPGAGAGILFSAYASHLLRSARPDTSLSVTAFEVDESLRPHLGRTATAVQEAWTNQGLACDVAVRYEDFTESASREGLGDLFGFPQSYDVAILNPPYQKLSSRSDLRGRLDALGICAPNLYAAFLGLALYLVAPGGHVVAIVPRSFCNGSYFKRFRHYLLENASIGELHLFESRDAAFGQDAVLQENVIISLTRGTASSDEVKLSFSEGNETTAIWQRKVRRSAVVEPGDPDLYIRFPADEWDEQIATRCSSLPCDLPALGLNVSTGPVVDFRNRDHLVAADQRGAVPLLYPSNFRDFTVRWPVDGAKPQGLLVNSVTEKSVVDAGWYVVTRRLSSKEESRRVVASVVDPSLLPADQIAFENHLNFFHAQGGPMGRNLALGLATFLNTTAVDRYFRQFSGHTQVNAGDLRKFRYPNRDDLERIGKGLTSPLLGKEADAAVAHHCDQWRRCLHVAGA